MLLTYILTIVTSTLPPTTTTMLPTIQTLQTLLQAETTTTITITIVHTINKDPRRTTTTPPTTTMHHITNTTISLEEETPPHHHCNNMGRRLIDRMYLLPRDKVSRTPLRHVDNMYPPILLHNSTNGVLSSQINFPRCDMAFGTSLYS